MLAPPPEAVESRDKTALDDAGRQRYLDSLERRLSKLEGASSGRRNQLTSKDILQSLSEARDDHMQQRGTASSRNRPQSTSWSNSGSGTGRESPFSIRNEFADVDLSGGVSAVEEVERGRRERVVMEGGGEERPASGSSIWTCCFRCRGSGGRRGYSRAGRGGTEADEDCSRLVDCDELSLEWQSQDINDVT